MNWSRFKYYCLEVRRRLDQDQAVKVAFDSAKGSVLAKTLGEELKPNTLPNAILTELKNSNVAPVAIKQAVEVYHGLDFTMLSAEPSRIRRVGIYITYLSFMYLVFSSIYSVFVIPSSLAMIESLNLEALESFTWFAQFWNVLALLIFGLLLCAFLISRKLKALFEYRHGVERSLVYRVLLPRKLKSDYELLITLLRLPLALSQSDDAAGASELVAYFRKEHYSSKEMSDCLSLLLNTNLQRVLVAAETYLRRLYVTTTVLVIFSIFIFISSAYAPIFMIGEGV